MTIVTAAQIVSQDDSVATLIMSSLALVIIAVTGAVATLVLRSVRRSAAKLDETNRAVHDVDGESIAAMVARMERRLSEAEQRTDAVITRVAGNEARITDLAGRVASAEMTASAAHRRLDGQAETLTDHDRRLHELEAAR